MAKTSRMSLSPRSLRRRRSISTGGSSAEAPLLPAPPISARCLAAALGNMHLASDFRLGNTSRMGLSPRSSSRRRRIISTGGSSAEAPRLSSPPISARCLAAALGNMHLDSDFRLANTSRMGLSPRSSRRRRSISSVEAPRLPPPPPPPPRQSVVRSARCLAAALWNRHLASNLHLQPTYILEGGKIIVFDLFNNNPIGMTGPHLIIVPHSVLRLWQFEFWTWLPCFTTILYDGQPEQRKSIRERYFGDGKFNVLLTHYNMILTDKKFLSKLSWYYLIVDHGKPQLSNWMSTHIDTTKKAFDYKRSFFVQNLI